MCACVAHCSRNRRSHFTQWKRLSISCGDPRELHEAKVHYRRPSLMLFVAARKFARAASLGKQSQSVVRPPPQLFRVRLVLKRRCDVFHKCRIDLRSPWRRYPLCCLIGFSNYSPCLFVLCLRSRLSHFRRFGGWPVTTSRSVT